MRLKQDYFGGGKTSKPKPSNQTFRPQTSNAMNAGYSGMNYTQYKPSKPVKRPVKNPVKRPNLGQSLIGFTTNAAKNFANNYLQANKDKFTKPKPSANNSYSNSGGGSKGYASTNNSYAAPVVDNRVNELIEYTKKQNEESRKNALDALLAAGAKQEQIYNNQLNTLKAQYDTDRDKALGSLDLQYKTAKDKYNTQVEDLTDQYQDLRNQSEVERYKSKSAIREALANRGQLDSGYGRQEMLNMGINYGNTIGKINRQEAAEKQNIANLLAQLENDTNNRRNDINNQYNMQYNKAQNDIKNAIAQLQAENEMKKVQINQQYDNALAQILAAMGK